VKLDAKTVTAIGTVLVALLGGAELRMAVGRLEAKVDRLDDRVGQLERTIEPRHVALRDQE